MAYSLRDIKRLHEIEPSIITRDNDRIIAYVPALDPVIKKDSLILTLLLELFDEINYERKGISTYHFLIIVQACIDKYYFGKGVFKKTTISFPVTTECSPSAAIL